MDAGKQDLGGGAVTGNEKIWGQTMGVRAYRGFRKRSLEEMRSRGEGQSVQWLIYVMLEAPHGMTGVKAQKCQHRRCSQSSLAPTPSLRHGVL